MRARLVEAWPDLSKHFGIHPWDTGRLTEPEIHAYLDRLRDMAKQAQEAARPSRRRR